MIRMILATGALAALLAAPAAAQASAAREKVRRQMQEISDLMRESERLLLEITRVDRLLEKQADIVRRLEELEQPPQQGQPAPADREKQRQELREQQQQTEKKLREMFDQQKQKAELSVEELVKLLQSLPRGQGRSPHGGDPKEQQQTKPKDQEDKQLRDEKKQRGPNSPREKSAHENKPKPGNRKPDDKTEASRLRRIEAWIARLPPEIQERLNRGDFSGVPVRYRRLVREYTALRAKRESTPDDE